MYTGGDQRGGDIAGRKMNTGGDEREGLGGSKRGGGDEREELSSNRNLNLCWFRNSAEEKEMPH